MLKQPAIANPRNVSGYFMKITLITFFVYLLAFSCQLNKPESKSLKTNTQQIVYTSDPIESEEEEIKREYLEFLDRVRENPYSSAFQTTLSGGYSIMHSFDSLEQYLILKKGKKFVDTIGGGAFYELYKNIGYIAADFDNYFVFAFSYGSGNPHYIKLLEKGTAKNLIKTGSVWIDADEKKQLLLFGYAGQEENYRDSMTLYDIKNQLIKKYPIPKKVLNDPEIFNRIKLIKVDSNEIVIEYEIYESHKTYRKTYSR